MNVDNIYLERYGFPEQLILAPPSPSLGIVITIPCYDEPDLISTLSALYDCEKPSSQVEVLVVVNRPSDATSGLVENNKRTVQSFHQWDKRSTKKWLRYFLIQKEDIPPRQAGVGYARKIAMDEAVRRFNQVESREGIIVGLDADCLVDRNYLREIENHFVNHPKTNGCSIYFEHPLEGPLDPLIYQGIVHYELHLRYLVNGLKFAGFPFAFQTLGSSMAVLSSVYQRQGGMNRRQAGEDFHFLHKIIGLGNFTNLNSTRIIPSPRVSDRVPFGTGKAIGQWLNRHNLETFNPKSFELLKSMNSVMVQFYRADSKEVASWVSRLPKPVSDYLEKIRFTDRIREINQQSTTNSTFLNRLYLYFNGLRVIKMAHYLRDQLNPNVPVDHAAKWLLEQMDYPIAGHQTSRELLLKIREIDRS